MSKEFHVFTHQDTNYEQALVFEVNRHEDDSVEFSDLLMVTQTQHGELRTRIKFEDMIQSILKTNGGNIDDNGVSVIVEMFKDLIPVEKQQEIQQEITDRLIYNIDPEELIKGYDYNDIFEQSKNDDFSERTKR